VAEQLALAASPHLEQVDDALSGPFGTPVPIMGQNDSPSEEGPFVISPSSSAAAIPDSSVIASSSMYPCSVQCVAYDESMIEYTLKALQEKGRAKAEGCMGEIIRSLPSHLLVLLSLYYFTLYGLYILFSTLPTFLTLHRSRATLYYLMNF
jgi:hypothetical protein